MASTTLIYNPKAGAKKRLGSQNTQATIRQIRRLLSKYGIEADETPTKGPGDACRLAREAAASGAETVIVAGGDGTVGEAANGLVGTETALGILPLGTFMNVARMLTIPLDLERAVMVLRMRQIRTIDVGQVLSIGGTRIDEPLYFLEAAGIGLEARFQRGVLEMERGDPDAFWRLLKSLWKPRRAPIRIELDEGRVFESRAQIILVTNGPYEGAGLHVAPTAKLNDHRLTVRCYGMNHLELLAHFLKIKMAGSDKEPHIFTATSSSVRLTSSGSAHVHADARVFGRTPVHMTVVPAALRVIAGFQDSPEEGALLQEETYLAP